MDEDIVGVAASWKRYLRAKDDETTVVTDGRKLTAPRERIARTIDRNYRGDRCTTGRGGWRTDVPQINLLHTPVGRARKIRRSGGKGNEAPVRAECGLLRSMITGNARIACRYRGARSGEGAGRAVRRA